MNKFDLQALAQMRLDEAKILLDNGQYSGAYYLCGYAVECALKACIAKNTQQFDFPDKELANKSWTHDFITLLTLLKLDDARKASDVNVKANWEIVRKWSESARYATKTQIEAETLYNAVTDSTYGVFQWVKQYY